MKKLDFPLKAQKFCAKTQLIGGQVPLITSLTLPKKPCAFIIHGVCISLDHVTLFNLFTFS